MKITKDRQTQWLITDSNTKHSIEHNVVLHTSNATAIYEKAGVHGNKYSIEGSVISAVGDHFAAIESYGNSGNWTIGLSGSLMGNYGFISRGDSASLTNYGNIYSINACAVLFTHGDHKIRNDGVITVTTDSTNAIELYKGDYALINSGLISADHAILISNSDLNVINTGSIRSFGVAIEIIGKGSLDIQNQGTLDSDSAQAIYSNSGNDKIINTGRIFGSVNLGNGNDEFTNKAESHFFGNINLGNGNDNITLDGFYSSQNSHANYALIGGNGNDVFNLGSNDVLVTEGNTKGEDSITTYLSRSLEKNVENLSLLGRENVDGVGNELDNVLIGNMAANSLSGGDGDDLLKGGKGNDILSGGNGDDTFAYATGDKADVISDWKNGADLIDLTMLSGISDFNDLIANHSLQQGEDVIVSIGKDTLTLLQTDINSLTSDDFIF